MINRRRFLAASLGMVLAAPPSAAFAARLAHDEIGLILMHGKWGRAPGPLAPYFEREGYRVVSPEMPWSGRRYYDVPYRVGLAEVHHEVEKLRAAGAKMVFVGGESFGANGALAYQAEYGDADALVLLAPGHAPGGWYRSGETRDDVDRANALAKQGKLNERFTFTDQNDQPRRMTATVESYLSYFAPRGRGNMNVSAKRIKRPVATLVVNSAREVKVQGRAYIFDALPPHPRSLYVESPMEHGTAAEGARTDVQGFIDSLVKSL